METASELIRPNPTPRPMREPMITQKLPVKRNGMIPKMAAMTRPAVTVALSPILRAMKPEAMIMMIIENEGTVLNSSTLARGWSGNCLMSAGITPEIAFDEVSSREMESRENFISGPYPLRVAEVPAMEEVALVMLRPYNRNVLYCRLVIVCDYYARTKPVRKDETGSVRKNDEREAVRSARARTGPRRLRRRICRGWCRRSADPRPGTACGTCA